MHIGEKVRHLRDVRGLSQEELADKCGTSSSIISRLETGQIKQPSFSMVAKLADALGANLEYFLDEDARTPLQVTDKLPEDLKEFVINSKSIPYLYLAQDIADKDLDLPTYKHLVELLYKAMNMPSKE